MRTVYGSLMFSLIMPLLTPWAGAGPIQWPQGEARAAQRPGARRARNGEERGVAETKLIAVCDDEAAIADLVAQLLAQGGFEVRTFYAGAPLRPMGGIGAVAEARAARPAGRRCAARYEFVYVMGASFPRFLPPSIPKQRPRVP